MHPVKAERRSVSDVWSPGFREIGEECVLLLSEV